MMQDLISVKVVHLSASASIKIKNAALLPLASSSCTRVWYFDMQKMSVQIKREYRLAFVCYQSTQNMVLQNDMSGLIGHRPIWGRGLQCFCLSCGPKKGGGGDFYLAAIWSDRSSLGARWGIKVMLQEARVLLHHWHMGPSAGWWLSIVILTQRNWNC